MASKFVDNTRQVKAQARALHERAIEAHARASLEMSKPYVPFKSGALRESGKVEQIGPLRWEGSYNTAYAAAQNYGTIFIPGRYFVEMGLSMSHRIALNEFRNMGRAR